MPKLSCAILPVCLLALSAVPAAAQSEPDLKAFFEGKSVRVKIDMPGTQEGVDVYPDARQPLDMKQYSSRIKSYGIAIHNGESVMVTFVRVKEKLIEFQLGGGGYGTFGDDTSSVSVPTATKTQREKDLEKLVKSETDSGRKRRLQEELDDLRSAREREDARNRARAAAANEAKKDRIANDRLHSGSRFNVRYQNGVPPGLASDGVMRALEQYLEFPFAADVRPVSQSRPMPREEIVRPIGMGDLRKGMLVAEVESVLGKAEKTTPRTEGTLKAAVSTFTRGDQVITAEFVEGVLIKYSIASK